MPLPAGRRPCRAPSLLALLALAAGAGPAVAQPLAPRPDDVATLDGILRAWYDVVSVPPGVSPDWARDSTLYLPDIRFVLVGAAGEAGRFGARVVDHAAYTREATAALSRGFHEREIHRVTQRFGAMAHVFSTYEYRGTPDGPVFGRGINSIQLFHDGERWWIVGAAWMNEDEANPIPPEYLPGGSG